jgi:trimethylamine--corrinoid protein Co-methyltransferase
MARPHLSFLRPQDREFVHEQTVRVLEEVGVGFNNAKAIALLEAAGAPVDHHKLAARIPRALLEQCLATAPRRVTLAARDAAHDIVLDDGEPLACCADGEGCLVLDDATGEVRDATLQDVRDVTRLYDALPEIDFLWTSLSTREIDPAIAPLALDAIALRESSKHLQSVSPKEPAMVPALLDMLEAVAGTTLEERPIYSLILCTIAPLQHDPEMTDACLELCRHGVSLCVVPMPQMGSTSPMTVLGTVIVNMAEILSAVVLYQLAKPGCAVIHGPMPGASDMRTGLYLGGAPEVGLFNLACVEMSRFYGLPIIGSGSTTDAKGVDFQAAAEDTLLWLSVAAAGADGLVATSFIDGSRVLSPAKIVLDADALGMLKRFLRETDIGETTALMDDIAEVGIGGHYLSQKSTRRFAHAGELWQPRVFRRGTFAEHKGTTLVQDAAERARHILAEHEVLPLPDDVGRHLDRVVADFARTA